jgi:hypothetical protein
VCYGENRKKPLAPPSGVLLKPTLGTSRESLVGKRSFVLIQHATNAPRHSSNGGPGDATLALGFYDGLLAARSLDVQPRFVPIMAGGNTMALHVLLRSGRRPDQPASRSFGQKAA